MQVRLIPGIQAAFALLLVTAATSEAQQVQAAESFEQLRVLIGRGTNLSVTLRSGEEITGKIADLSSSSLTLEGMLRAVSEDDVTTIRQRRPDSLKNGAWWGLGAGVGVGLIAAAIGAGADSGYLGESTALAPVIIAAPLTSLLGAAVDALFQGYQVIYRRSGSPPARIAMSPSPGRGAQEIPASFYQMQVLAKTGDLVRVTNTAGRELRGTIAELTPSSMALLVDGNRSYLLEADVSLIRQRRKDPLTNGVLWGFGIGAGWGLATLLAGGCEHSVQFLPVCMGISGAIGSGIGAAVDGLIQGERVIYAKGLDSVPVRIDPLLTHNGGGILLSLRLGK